MLLLGASCFASAKGWVFLLEGALLVTQCGCVDVAKQSRACGVVMRLPRRVVKPAISPKHQRTSRKYIEAKARKERERERERLPQASGRGSGADGMGAQSHFRENGCVLRRFSVFPHRFFNVFCATSF